MRAQLAPQASMQMRRPMPRGMAPARNISASPQATVQRPGEVPPSPAPQPRPPRENSIQRPTPPTQGKFDLKKPVMQTTEILCLRKCKKNLLSR